MKHFSIDELEQSGYFSEIDIHFARFVTRRSKGAEPNPYLAAALVSHASGDGDVCLDISAMAGRYLERSETRGSSIRCPDLVPWVKSLHRSRFIGSPGEYSPLVLDGKQRLYLYRYWEYENLLAKDIIRRASAEIQGVDIPLLKQGIRRLFPDRRPEHTDWQKVASVVSVLKRFCVITGGPGTGKTYTVVKILAILAEQGPSRVLLAAPTGKAAARMAESIAEAKSNLDCREEVINAIPTDAYTLHRMLKPIPGSPYFQHHSDNLLPVDILVVDEASMVDLALMSKLVQAVPEEARLILIGDKDQLASVAAGSVLGDICNRENLNRYSKGFRREIETIIDDPLNCQDVSDGKQTPLQDSIVILEQSHRFSSKSGINSFSRAVNLGDADRAMATLKEDAVRSIFWQPVYSPDELYRFLAKPILDGYRIDYKTVDPKERIGRIHRERILCALKKGPFGADSINRFAETELRKAGIIFTGSSDWYHGRPVLITENDYLLSLYNGDIGIALPDMASGSETLFVYFQDPSGGLRAIPPFRLPAHETVYAMTVHKSQGSEFDHVSLVLPDQTAPLLTRELLYTAVTRARKTVTIYGSEQVLRTTITNKIDRASGLRDALW